MKSECKKLTEGSGWSGLREPMRWIAFVLGVVALAAPAHAQEKVQIYRLINGPLHFYITDCEGLISVQKDDHYSLEGGAGYISKTPFPTGMPLYRQYDPIRGAHFYTADRQEWQSYLNNGYKNEGIIGYISAVPGPDLVPLYRSHNASSNDFFMTINPTEWENATRSGWGKDRIVGYVWTSGARCSPPPGAPQACTARWAGDDHSCTIKTGECDARVEWAFCHNPTRITPACCRCMPGDVPIVDCGKGRAAGTVR